MTVADITKHIQTGDCSDKVVIALSTGIFEIKNIFRTVEGVLVIEADTTKYRGMVI